MPASGKSAIFPLHMKHSRAHWFNLVLFFLQRLLLVNVVFLGVGFLWRLAFLFAYGNKTEILSFKSDTLQAFILGARFDATLLFYISAVPLLIWLILGVLSFLPPLQRVLNKIFTHFGKFLLPYYFLMLFTINFLSATDLGFYGFYQDRINILIFGFVEDDTWALIKTIWKNYPMIWIFVGLCLFAWALHRGLSKAFSVSAQDKFLAKNKPETLAYPLWVGFLFALFLLNGVGARGSVTLFPLSEMDTGISKSAFINHLCFNGTRAFTRAIELKAQQKSSWDSNLRRYGYAENPEQAFADYFKKPLNELPSDPLDLLKTTTAENKWAEQNRPHVILLVMESWGGYWMRYNAADFNLVGAMQTHITQDSFTTHFLSGASGTIGSLSSLMAGVPQRPIGEFLTESEYLQVPFRTSLAKNYKNEGYKTRFVYGGNPGWREVNKFALMQGFDTVEGESEIAEGLGQTQNKIQEKHDWGIYDEDVFEYLWQNLIQASSPELFLAMTTTNHPPYQLPKNYEKPVLNIPAELQNKLIIDSGLAQQRFQTYRYSMEKLASFISRIKNSALKDKVIIAVTGDHTFWIVNFLESEQLQKGSVPFYLYTPAGLQKKFPADRFGSHIDIPATLYALSFSKASVQQLGQDLMADTDNHVAMNAYNLIADKSGGVLTGASPADDHYFGWQGSFDALTPTSETDHQKALALRYRSLMSLLDYYFVKEKNENSRR